MRIVWLVAVICLVLGIVNSCFALTVSDDDNYPYRIYIGGDKVVDWVDIVSVGYVCDGKFITLFEDKSPIQRVYMDRNLLGEEFYWILKQNSTWKFFDEGLKSRLQLVYPITPKETNPVLIYERKN